MSSRINIPSYIEDPNYRYWRPALKLKVESSGNGVKTKILNPKELAAKLEVPIEYPLKFLSLQFGSQLIFKEKGNDITVVLKGKFTDVEMTKALDKFAEKFLLCPSCTYPELMMQVKKKKVYGICRACGKSCELDNQHDFASYIIKHPPSAVDKMKPVSKPTDEADNTKPDPETVEEKKSEEEPEEEKLDECCLTGLEDKITEIRRLYESQKLDSYKGKKEEIKAIADLLNSYKLKPHLKSLILFQAVFDANILKQVAKNRELVSEIQKEFKLPFEELDLLLNLEYLLYETYKAQPLEKFIPTILHSFYDQDLLKEEFLLEWDSNAYLMNMKGDPRFKVEFDKQFKETAKEMINWLKTAQVEDE